MHKVLLQPSPATSGDRLCYGLNELASLLGISTVSVWRLEKKGLLRPVVGLRKKLYSAKEVERFLERKAVKS